MSSGASSFADGISADDRTGSIVQQPIALDVVSPEDSAIAAAPAGETNQTPRHLAALEPVPRSFEQDSLAAEEAQSLEALAPAEKPLDATADTRFAAVAPAAAGSSDALRQAPAFSQLPEGLVDPAEAAAEARIPALYANIEHGECKGGWGPKPRMINATRMTPGHPYYMEMRLRHTPPLPVGHVYIAYGRLGPNGEPLDEKLIMLAPVGGYGGAAFAAAVPMPGVLEPYGDDCILRPVAAYRLSLTAQKFEQLLLEIERQKEKKPTYSLFAYNCNMFMSDVAKSVGILPPENIYTASLTYFYEMMDRNEGRKVARTAEELKLASATGFRAQ